MEHRIVDTGVLTTLHCISAFKFFEIMITCSMLVNHGDIKENAGPSTKFSTALHSI